MIKSSFKGQVIQTRAGWEPSIPGKDRGRSTVIVGLFISKVDLRLRLRLLSGAFGTGRAEKIQFVDLFGSFW